MSVRQAQRRSQAVKTERPTPHWSQGGLLAVEMLQELESDETGGMCRIDDSWRERGTPQRNIAAEYLSRLRGAEQNAGFCAILSNALAMMLGSGGGRPSFEWLELLATLPHREARAKFERRNRRRFKAAMKKLQADSEVQP